MPIHPTPNCLPEWNTKNLKYKWDCVFNYTAHSANKLFLPLILLLMWCSGDLRVWLRIFSLSVALIGWLAHLLLSWVCIYIPYMSGFPMYHPTSNQLHMHTQWLSNLKLPPLPPVLGSSHHGDLRSYHLGVAGFEMEGCKGNLPKAHAQSQGPCWGLLAICGLLQVMTPPRFKEKSPHVRAIGPLGRQHWSSAATVLYNVTKSLS